LDLGLLTGFVFVFGVVGFFELFDRTSFALIALATRARPVLTWAGGASAFVVTTALAVTLGATLEGILGPGRIGLLRVAGGVFLLGYAGWLYFHRSTEKEIAEGRRMPSPFAAAFLTIFLLELGDTTMIFEIVFVTDWGWLVVLLGGGLALVAVAAWDVLLGSKLGTRVNEDLLDRIVVVVLVIVGAVTIAYGLAPTAFPVVGSLLA
jgi:Ca2+/H+ antiporter, TMEM165/GDT1 family